MKQPRNVIDLAANLKAAAATAVGHQPVPPTAPATAAEPPPVAQQDAVSGTTTSQHHDAVTSQSPEAVPAAARAATAVANRPQVPPSSPPRARTARPAGRPVTLRMPPELLEKYVQAALARGQEQGRVVSAQEIMLERLGVGP
jgi:hypothetical protein